MTIATKRPTIEDLVQRTDFKERHVLLKLHNYLLNENNEMYHYLDRKKELEDFLVTRTNKADRAYRDAISDGVPAPEEIRNQILFIGIENSILEYIESMLEEVPCFKEKIEKSSRAEMTYQKLALGAVPIFYDRLNTPYSESMDELDATLIAYLEEQQGIFRF